MKNQYRIVTDTYSGFEAQIRYWFFPFCWFQLDKLGRGLGTNTNTTVREAEDVVRAHKYGPPPEPPLPKVVKRLY